MSKGMTHRERFEAAVRGGDVDRPPISMWRHFFTEEQTTRGLAQAMLGFQKKYDWDYMKFNPRASYHVEDWGVKLRYTGDSQPKVTATPVKSPADWTRLEPLPADKGVLGEHLKALETVSKGLKGEIPILATVFTPFSIASRLAASDTAFLRDVREHPDKVAHALEVVTETFARYAKACMERGAVGLFYAATVWSNAAAMPRDEYTRVARPSDLALLKKLPKGGIHMLHVCKDENYLDLVADYPVQVFNWDARGKGNPSLAEGKALLKGKAVAGGIPHQEALVTGRPAELTGEVRGMRVAMGSRGWMLGSGCTYPGTTPGRNVRAIRQAVG
ncbi:MAG: uroporphyrinogen decarboxylase [SAR202 cluster bacterium]|nr:uroporphyrinogen decarboxylase [SAR202 cluster bacterium]